MCTVIPTSKSPPKRVMPYHHKIFWEPLLPEPYTNEFSWVLGDMIYTVGFERLKLLSCGKDEQGKRIYDVRVLNEATLNAVMACVKYGIGLTA